MKEEEKNPSRVDFATERVRREGPSRSWYIKYIYIFLYQTCGKPEGFRSLVLIPGLIQAGQTNILEGLGMYVPNVSSTFSTLVE